MTKKIDNTKELDKFNIEDFIGEKRSHPNDMASEQSQASEPSKPTEQEETTQEAASNNATKKPLSGKQRKSNLREYQETF